MADKKVKAKRKSKLVKKADMAQLINSISQKSREEIHRDTIHVMQSNFSVPLKLEDSVWSEFQHSEEIVNICKELFDFLIALLKQEKGADKMPKVLSKWFQFMGSVINDDTHKVNRVIQQKHVSSCLLMAVKDTVWNYIYSQKKNETSVDSNDADKEVQKKTNIDDNVSLYRLGSYALFRMKKTAWKKVKSRFSSKKTVKNMLAVLEIIKVVEEINPSKFPTFIQQNRNLLVMKNCLLPFVQLFSKEFHLSVDYSSYTKYGKDIFKVAEKQLLYNKTIELSLVNIFPTNEVKYAKNDLKRFRKEFTKKIFNIRCKAFLKSIELLEEENEGRALDRDVMLRQKLKVDKTTKKGANKTCTARKEKRGKGTET